MSILSSKNNKDNWDGKLRVKIYRNGAQDEDVKLEENELIHALSKYIPKDDYLLKMHYYTCRGMGNMGLGNIHSFVVIETNMHYWSLERQRGGVGLQRSKNIQKVTENCFDQPRVKSIDLIFSTNQLHSQVYTMTHVLKWIIETGELHDHYSLVHNNCRDTARRLVHRFCSRDDDRTFAWKVTFGGGGQIMALLLFPIRHIKLAADRARELYY